MGLQNSKSNGVRAEVIHQFGVTRPRNASYRTLGSGVRKLFSFGTEDACRPAAEESASYTPVPEGLFGTTIY